MKLHWSLPLDSGQQSASGGFDAGLVDVDGIIEFARKAELFGIDSLLMPMSCYMPDPIPLLGALTYATKNIKYILAYRPGLVSPTLLVQILNTLSCMSHGRVDLNLVAGISPQEQAYYGDFLTHDERYARADEFLRIMLALWEAKGNCSFEGKHYRIENAKLGLSAYQKKRPRIYVSGASAVAQELAATQSDCWLRYGDVPEKVEAEAVQVLAAGRGVGLRMHVIARPTRDEALAAIDAMMASPDMAHRQFIADFVAKCDSEAVKGSFRLAEQYPDDWASPYLWTGAVPYRGGPAIAIVGSYEEVADYLQSYERHGTSDFILSGWPSRAELEHFGSGVMPLLRERGSLNE